MRIFLSILILANSFVCFSKDYQLVSPNKDIELNISVNNGGVTISILNEKRMVLKDSPIGMIIDEVNICDNSEVVKESSKLVDGLVRPIVSVKSDVIRDNYNELMLSFRAGYSLTFRAYNEGVAYRFSTEFSKDSVIVNNEILNLEIPGNSKGFLMQEKGFYSMSESPYVCNEIERYEDNSLYSLPALFQTPEHDFLLILESDVYDYPGLWLKKEEGAFHSILPRKVLSTKTGHCTDQQYVTKRTDYIARTKAVRSFPWRIFAVAGQEGDLIMNQLVYLLARPAANIDYSWIQPGIATLDWWGRRNIFGTDFKGGVNTETHKYFVDFNHKYGLKYFVLDDGWSDACDLRIINKNLNLDELSAYAKEKGVGLVFWVHAFALKQDISGYLDFFKSKGAVGIKVDFFARDDQDAVNLFHQIAQAALDRQLIVDFHGICKPIGLNRTYPNVLTSEGLIEFEMNGVTDWDNPEHHTLLPFIRMVSGPMDYLPGTLNNAQKHEFYKNGDRPVGLGSRSHSMALNVLFESPITMLPDSPSDYLENEECTSFLSQIPVVWDETRVIDAKIGEYIILARRSGMDWYLAAITNWNSRELVVSLDFLEKGKYVLDCFMDGKNTEARAIDYVHKSQDVDANTIMNLSLSKGGGWVGRLSKR